VDETKDIRDKAEALRVYGRQRDNRELEHWAAEIKVRANPNHVQKSREEREFTGPPSCATFMTSYFKMIELVYFATA
jgi:hypothetical protein